MYNLIVDTTMQCLWDLGKGVCVSFFFSFQKLQTQSVGVESIHLVSAFWMQERSYSSSPSFYSSWAQHSKHLMLKSVPFKNFKGFESSETAQRWSGSKRSASRHPICTSLCCKGSQSFIHSIITKVLSLWMPDQGSSSFWHYSTALLSLVPICVVIY